MRYLSYLMFALLLPYWWIIEIFFLLTYCVFAVYAPPNLYRYRNHGDMEPYIVAFAMASSNRTPCRPHATHGSRQKFYVEQFANNGCCMQLVVMGEPRTDSAALS